MQKPCCYNIIFQSVAIVSLYLTILRKVTKYLTILFFNTFTELYHIMI